MVIKLRNVLNVTELYTLKWSVVGFVNSLLLLVSH